MNCLERFYPEVLFGGYSDIDGTISFYTRVNALLDASHVVLDLGCGRGQHEADPIPIRKNLRILRNKVAKVIGIDVDKGAKENPFLDEFRLIEGDSWPVESDSIDLIVCDNVLEHITDPDQFFSEIRRVLINGGYLCIRTPNRWNYVAMIALLIPNKFHSRVVSFAQDSNREEEDVFPTVYKCNSTCKLRKIMRKHGFDCVAYGYEAEPDYLSFSKIAYFLGVLYQRFAPGFFKSSIFAFGRIKK